MLWASGYFHAAAAPPGEAGEGLTNHKYTHIQTYTQHTCWFMHFTLPALNMPAYLNIYLSKLATGLISLAAPYQDIRWIPAGKQLLRTAIVVLYQGIALST